ncbi:hypothetical protein CTM85_17205 [Photobacterium phosphoreum]|jgi:hypothetical protein|nr:hypothetical protein CTM85_17205 [Photobacterium phosphoreum]
MGCLFFNVYISENYTWTPKALYINTVVCEGIAMHNKEQLTEAMDFIIEAIAQSTDENSKAEIGYYLANLVIMDHQQDFSARKKKCLMVLLKKADEIKAMR